MTNKVMLGITHTPGQWHAYSYCPGTDDGGDPFEDQLGVRTSTCEVCTGIQVLDDAQLIAAAPELLAALKAIIAVVGPQFGLDDAPTGTIDRIAYLARKAIATVKT